MNPYQQHWWHGEYGLKAFLKDTAPVIAVIIPLLAVLFGLLMVPMYFVSKRTCAEQWDNSGFAYTYTLWEGCMIQADGKWIPSSTYRRVEQ